MTFSIAARCERTGMFGVAITTSSISVGSRCPHARAGIGAVATQNITDPNLATLPLREARENFERDYLLLQINRFGGNISKTASFVGMERSALHRKLKSLNIVTNLKTGNRVAVVLENDSTNDYTA